MRCYATIETPTGTEAHRVQELRISDRTSITFETVYVEKKHSGRQFLTILPIFKPIFT